MKKVLSLIGLELIYFIIAFGCMFLGFLSPFCWVYQPVVAAFLAATPVLIVCKSRKGFGGVLALPGIFALIMIVLGEISGAFIICSVIVVLIAAELVRRAMGYESQKAARVSYAVVSLVPACSLLLLWLDKDFYYAGAVEEMGNVQYAESLMNLANPFGLIALIVCTICAGFLGAIVSEKIFKSKTVIG